MLWLVHPKVYGVFGIGSPQALLRVKADTKLTVFALGVQVGEYPAPLSIGIAEGDRWVFGEQRQAWLLTFLPTAIRSESILREYAEARKEIGHLTEGHLLRVHLPDVVNSKLLTETKSEQRRDPSIRAQG